MSTMDAFAADVFGMMELTGTVNEIDFVPQALATMGIFNGAPKRTTKVFIDRRKKTLSLIANSPRNAPPEEDRQADRSAVTLETTRLARSQKLYATEMQDVRAFGFENDVENAAAKMAELLGDLRAQQELTHEHHRLGAVQGKLLDADGTTVIYDYFAEFGHTEGAAINFALGTATTNVIGKFKEVERGMKRSAKGAYTPQTRIVGLAGDGFFDQVTAHPNIEKFYLQSLQGTRAAENQRPFSAFDIPGTDVTLINYRGTDDNSAVAIADAECKFFPQNAREVFEFAMGPDETFNGVNSPGQLLYAERVFEREANPGQSTWVDIQTRSFPLFICSRPEVLRKAVAA
ncbi:MAG: major capsid protein [Pseudomonadota bacterium]